MLILVQNTLSLRVFMGHPSGGKEGARDRCMQVVLEAEPWAAGNSGQGKER